MKITNTQVGDKFGRLTAEKKIKSGFYPSQDTWQFRCECGLTHSVRVGSVRSGQVSQCGSCAGKARNESRLAHCKHKKDHPLYGTWLNMTQRCGDSRRTGYKNYGGRGIKVCERWSDFWKFVEDMGPKPTPKHTIERKDNDGNYELANCCWATRSEQAQNRRRWI